MTERMSGIHGLACFRCIVLVFSYGKELMSPAGSCSRHYERSNDIHRETTTILAEVCTLLTQINERPSAVRNAGA